MSKAFVRGGQDDDESATAVGATSSFPSPPPKSRESLAFVALDCIEA